MNHYEVLAIISGKYAENELEAIQQKLNGYLEKHTSTVHYTQSLGRKKLAYPINHLSYGYYFLIEFDAESKNISKLDRDITLNNDILRHVIVRRDTVGAPKTFEKEIRRDEGAQGAPSRSSQIPAEYRTLFSVNTPSDQVQPPVVENMESSPVAPAIAETTSQETAVQEEIPLQNVASQNADEQAVPAIAPQPTQIQPQDEVDTSEVSEEIPATKKKSKKVSYEELDKKLDELLKDDIL